MASEILIMGNLFRTVGMANLRVCVLRIPGYFVSVTALALPLLAVPCSRWIDAGFESERGI